MTQGLLPTDMTAHRAPVTAGEALPSEARRTPAASTGALSRPHEVNWPFAASLGAAWVHFPAVGGCLRDLGTGAVRACREFVVATLRTWGAAGRQDDVTVVVSELVTNALRHAVPRPAGGPVRWPVQLGLAWPGADLFCAVSDPSDLLPVPRDAGPLDETGRGLQVIASLSDEWGSTPPGHMGKVVWARFTVTPPTVAG